VTLSGLKTENGVVGFGIKTRTAGTIVLVLKADVTNSPNLPLSKALTADKTAPFTPLVNEFYFIDA
jgi:hypothetical protein